MPTLLYDSARAALWTAGNSESTVWQASTVRILGAQLLQGGSTVALHTYDSADRSDAVCEYSLRDGKLLRCPVRVHDSTLDPLAAQQHFVVLEAPVVRTTTTDNSTTVSKTRRRGHHPTHTVPPPPVLLLYSQAGQTLLCYSWRDGSFEAVVYHGALRALVALDNSTLAWLSASDALSVVNATLDSEDSLQHWSFVPRWRLAMPSPDHLALRRRTGELFVVCTQADGSGAALWMHSENGTMLGSTPFPLGSLASTQPLDDGTFVLLQPDSGTAARYAPWPRDTLLATMDGVRGSVLLPTTTTTSGDFWLLGAQVARIETAASTSVLSASTRVGSGHSAAAASSELWPLSFRGNVAVAEHTALLDCSHTLVLQERGSLVRYSLDHEQSYLGEWPLPHASLLLDDGYDECAQGEHDPWYVLAHNSTHLVEIRSSSNGAVPDHTSSAPLPCRAHALLYCGRTTRRRACILCASDNGGDDSLTLYVAVPTAGPPSSQLDYTLQPIVNTAPYLASTRALGLTYDERRDAVVAVHYDSATHSLHVARMQFSSGGAASRRQHHALGEWEAAALVALPANVALDNVTFSTPSLLTCDDGAVVLRVNATLLLCENEGHAHWTPLISAAPLPAGIRSVRQAFLTRGFHQSAWHGLVSLLIVLCMTSPVCALVCCLVVYQARVHGVGAGLRRLKRYVPYKAQDRRRLVVYAIDALRRFYTLLCCCAPGAVRWLDRRVVGERHARMQDAADSALPEDGDFEKIWFAAHPNDVPMTDSAGSGASLHRRRNSSVELPAPGSNSSAQLKPFPGKVLDDVELSQ